MKIKLKSIGFKYHHEFEDDVLIIDCLRLPDPVNIFGTTVSGLDQEVRSYLDLKSKDFLARVKTKIEEWLKNKAPGSTAIIYFGCAGGLHRSVYMTEKIGEWLKHNGHRVEIKHLDKDRY